MVRAEEQEVFTTQTDRPSCQSAVRLIRCDSCARDTPMVRLTRAILRPLAQGRVRYPFSRLTVLHDFFQELNIHRLLAQKALEFPDLLQCSCELRGRNDFFSSRNGGETTFLILLLPLKQLPGLNTVQAGNMGEIHARLHRLLDDGDLILPM